MQIRRDTTEACVRLNLTESSILRDELKGLTHSKSSDILYSSWNPNKVHVSWPYCSVIRVGPVWRLFELDRFALFFILMLSNRIWLLVISILVSKKFITYHIKFFASIFSLPLGFLFCLWDRGYIWLTLKGPVGSLFILLCRTPDDFTCQGKSSRLERVKQLIKKHFFKELQKVVNLQCLKCNDWPC